MAADPEEAGTHLPPAPAFKNMAQHDQEKKIFHDHNIPKEGGRRRYGYAAVTDSRRRAVSSFIVLLLVLAGVTALTLWLLYRPHKPKFWVVGAAVYQLNSTSPPFISTTMQFTLLTRNPNKRVSISYDQLSAFVAYRNQAITVPAALPPLYHETKSTVALSPVLGGSPVPVGPEVVNGLAMDQDYGVVGLRLVLTGKLRYKGGAFVKNRRSSVFVRCDLFVGFKTDFLGQLPLLGSPPCRVDVS